MLGGDVRWIVIGYVLPNQCSNSIHGAKDFVEQKAQGWHLYLVNTCKDHPVLSQKLLQ